MFEERRRRVIDVITPVDWKTPNGCVGSSRRTGESCLVA